MAPVLTPRAVLASLGAIQMVEAHIPTTDGRTLILPRHTEPEAEQRMLLEKLGLSLPQQPPPRIRAGQIDLTTPDSARNCSADLGSKIRVADPARAVTDA